MTLSPSCLWKNEDRMNSRKLKTHSVARLQKQTTSWNETPSSQESDFHGVFFRMQFSFITFCEEEHD